MDVELISSETPFHGKAFSVRVDRLRLWNGSEVRRDVVVHPDAVGVLVLTPQRRVVLIRQYRRPAGTLVWEIPAGKIDEGETPVQAACRELMEETGMTARDYEEIAVFHPSPGICTEKVHVFLAHVLEEGARHDPEEEIVECRTFPIEEARAMIGRGEITDGKTILALLLEQTKV